MVAKQTTMSDITKLLTWPLEAPKQPAAAVAAVTTTFLVTGQLPWQTLPTLDYVRGYGIASVVFFVASEVLKLDAMIDKVLKGNRGGVAEPP